MLPPPPISTAVTDPEATARRQRPASLGTAAAASLLVHVGIGIVLGAVVSLRPFALGTSAIPLSVALVATPNPIAPALPEVPMALPEIIAPPAPMAVVPEPEPSSTPLAAPPVPPPPVILDVAPPQSPAPASLTTGEIRVTEFYAALSSFPEELVGRSQSEYLIEVDQLVSVARHPDVVYPAAAREAKREGTVLVWLAISREGAVEDTIIVSGEPEFVAAVEAALPSARFGPAVNRGEIVPFYIILRFDFRGG